MAHGADCRHVTGLQLFKFLPSNFTLRSKHIFLVNKVNILCFILKVVVLFLGCSLWADEEWVMQPLRSFGLGTHDIIYPQIMCEQLKVKMNVKNELSNCFLSWPLRGNKGNNMYCNLQSKADTIGGFKEHSMVKLPM